jgi:hypothetical protein
VYILKKWFFEKLTTMKKFIITSILAVLIVGSTATGRDWRDEYLGLPGDNLNLFAVMKLFQESRTLEGFERDLNSSEYRINNLDLNDDNLVDYIQVQDFVDGRIHNIVLRVAINRFEYQDVALFTVEKFRNGSVHIQLIGDEAIYGRNYIIEPIYDGKTNNKAFRKYIRKSGYGNHIVFVRTSPLQVAGWPIIRYVYSPGYMVWHTSWHWDYYPAHWHPWRPFYWHYYYGYHHNWYDYYFSHYRYWNIPRYSRYNDFYYANIRMHAPKVTDRVKRGDYNKTYSHPEKRHEGEALFAQVHPEQVTRRVDNTGIIRPEARPEMERNNAPADRENVSRRSASPVVKQKTSSRPAQTAEPSRRTAPTVKQETRTVEVRTSEVSRRASPTVENGNKQKVKSDVSKESRRSASEVNKR